MSQKTSISGLPAFASLLAEHRKALRYCTTCPKMCRSACPVAHQEARETVTPWGLMALIHSAATGLLPVDQDLASILARCTGCLACHDACLHPIHVPQVVFAARARLRAAGLEQGWVPERCSHGESVGHTISDGSRLGFAASSDVGYLPGCAAGEGRTGRVASMLTRLDVEVQLVETSLRGCGYDLLAGGMEEDYAEHASHLSAAMAPFATVVAECPRLGELVNTPGWSAPWGARRAPRVVHWTELVWEAVELASAKPLQTAGPVAFHACAPGTARGVGGEASRALTEWATGASVIDIADHQAGGAACGVGAGYEQVAPGHAEAMALEVLEWAASRATRLVVTESACAAHLRRVASSRRDSGTELAIVELIDVVADALPGAAKEECTS